MLDKLKPQLRPDSSDTPGMDNILEDLPLMSDDPQKLIENSADKPEEEANPEQKSRGFVLQSHTLKPNRPQADPSASAPSGNADNMMLIDVVRYSSGTHDTLGKFYINGVEQCYTLEDEYREVKKHGDTRIPAGTYNVTLRTVGGKHASYWSRFKDIHKGMLWIRNIPNYEYVLIHIGNHDAHTEGCILVGLQPDPSKENKLEEKRQIWSSTAAYKKIYPPIANHLAAGNQVVIRVTDPE